jgi:hypothetical protein
LVAVLSSSSILTQGYIKEEVLRLQKHNSVKGAPWIPYYALFIPNSHIKDSNPCPSQSEANVLATTLHNCYICYKKNGSLEEKINAAFFSVLIIKSSKIGLF